MTARAGGARSSIAFVMPVSCSMNGGTQAPLRIRLWNRPTISPPRTSTAATSVARAPIAGDMPVVSKSMTATVSRDGQAVRIGWARLWGKLYVRTACRRKGSRLAEVAVPR